LKISGWKLSGLELGDGEHSMLYHCQ